ncbi:MAG: orotate phosphoribosyltransferase [Myxococcota bacterium]
MTHSTSERDRLATLLCEHSLEEGSFTLSSGKSASVYIDSKRTVLSGEGAFLAGRLLWELIAPLGDVAGVGGLTLGADPLVTSIAMAAHADSRDIGAIIVRKESKGHGTNNYLEMPPTLGTGDQIVAVDDVITTGGSTIDAIEKMRDQGFVIEHAVCLVDREDVGARALADVGVELHPLFTLSQLLEFRGSK